MGLFKGRQIFTASASFNLAGELKDRSNYLKTAVVSAVLADNDMGIGEQLSRAYLRGPGTKLKSFHQWALLNYQDIGTPFETRLNIKTAVANDVRPLIISQYNPADEIAVQGIEIGQASYQYFAEQYMFENHPDLFGSFWTADIDDTTNLITITFQDTTTASFTPASFDKSKLYMYATWRTSNLKGLFIYEIGSGDPVLDTLLETYQRPSDAYYPVIPIRLDNQFLTEADGQLYTLASRAVKKATGASFSEIVENMSEEQEALDGVDYAYVVFGASANTEEQAQLEYIWEWMEDMGEGTEWNNQSYTYEQWQSNVPGHIAEVEYHSTYEELNDEGQNPPDPPPGYTPGQNGGAGPDGPPSRPYRGVQIRPPGTIDINYDVRITWGGISKHTGQAGLGKPDAKVGEYWFGVPGESFDYTLLSISNVENFSSARTENVVHLYHQVSETEYEYIRIWGMKQETYVFGSHSEEIRLSDAVLLNQDGAESSFIIPLRYSTLASMSLKDATQFAMSCQHLLIHSYQVVITRSFLQIVLIVAVVAITAATGGFGATSAGVLGANASVGLALGASAATAAIVGAVANVLAAMVLTKIITAAATEIFGEQLGAIIGAAISFATINGLSNVASGNGFVLDFGNLSSAKTLMTLTNAAGNAYTSYVQAGIQKTLAETQELVENYKTEMEKIEEAYEQNIGYDRGTINPFELTDAGDPAVESPSVFFARTLMTGSDIAELSLGMLSNFARISLSTDLSLD